jgi:hypothetical protein
VLVARAGGGGMPHMVKVSEVYRVKPPRCPPQPIHRLRTEASEVTSPEPARSLPALARACDRWTDKPWEIIRDVAREAGPAMQTAIAVALRWDKLKPNERAGVLWDMSTAHAIASTEERHVDFPVMGTRMTEFAAAIRHAHDLSTGRETGSRIPRGILAEEVGTRFLRLPTGWQTEALRRMAIGDLDPLGAVGDAERAINVTRHVYGLATE